MLKLFFTYFGGKWRIAKHYPRPQHQTIIEPFAGSAGYALHYPHLNVKLYDVDPTICGLWKYLIGVSSDEILKLPVNINHIDEAKVCEEAKWLIGFWFNKGSNSPRFTPTTWMKSNLRPNSYWGEAIRLRIASQVDLIRHWTIEQKSFEKIDNQDVTWFIDPPYHKAGSIYRYNKINYEDLAVFCKDRLGLVIVCEQEGASWLPFEYFRTIKTAEGSRGKSKGNEVVWMKGEDKQDLFTLGDTL